MQAANTNLPIRVVAQAMRASAPVPAAPDANRAPATNAAQPGGFARQMELAAQMIEINRDAGIAIYFKAVRTADTVYDALLVVDAAFGRKLGMNDLRIVAMNKVILLTKGFDEGMDVAAALHGKGMSADGWAKAALHKALDAATTPEQAMAVASFAQENGRLLRYREIAAEATTKAQVLASMQGIKR